MKKKNGFTLIELLVVIALLGLIISVSMPSILKTVKKANKNLCKSKSELVLSAAELYAQDTKYTGNKTVSELLQLGYIDADEKEGDSHCPSGNTYGCIINPLNNESLNSKVINISKKDKTYTAVWVNAKSEICGE